MKDSIALKISAFRMARDTDDPERVLIEELFEELIKCQVQLTVAQHTENHLRSAERALIEKDETIAKWQAAYARALDRTEGFQKTIDLQRDRVGFLEKEVANNKVRRQRIEKFYSDQVEAAKTQIAKLQEELSKMREERNKYKSICESNTSTICLNKLREERNRYKAALKDLEGTMCASRDHNAELANAIHTILN